MTSELDPLDIATAGEYVLGTLPLSERDQFRSRLANEPLLMAEVSRWEAHFDPLADEVRPITPSTKVWDQIESHIFAAPSTKRGGARNALWQWLAIGSLCASAVLATFLWLGRVGPPEGHNLWVSDMISEDNQIRLTALYDEISGEMRVSVGGRPPGDGRDFELWLIQGERAPISLGVMPRAGQAAMPIPAAFRALVANATLAITDEPLGGSPGGVATGPVVAAAPLRRI
jgi:anti-sigma-K factor RskA